MKTFTLLVIFLFSIAATMAQTAERMVRPREIAFTQFSGGVSTANLDDSNAIRYANSADTNYSVQDIYEYNDNTLSYDSDELALQSFSADGHIDTLVTQPWDTTKKMYVNSLRVMYYSDGNYNDTLILQQSWNPANSTWYYVFKTIYGLKNGNDTSYTVYIYDTTTKVWSGANQIIYTYDSHNRLTLESDGSWNGTGWTVTPSEQYDNNYDANNNDTAIVIANYNGSVWDTTDLESYTINKSGQDSVEIYSQRTNKHTWLKDDKYIYNYNANNKYTGTLEQLWNASDSSWHNYSLDVFSYNNYNQTISDSFLSWGSNGPWYVTFSSLYYYQDVTTGFNQLAVDGGQWTVYPNPTTNFIHTDVQLKQPTNLQLRLINMLGQTLWVTDAGNVSSYQTNISVANLPDGVYLLEMVTGGGTESKEIIVAR